MSTRGALAAFTSSTSAICERSRWSPTATSRTCWRTCGAVAAVAAGLRLPAGVGRGWPGCRTQPEAARDERRQNENREAAGEREPSRNEPLAHVQPPARRGCARAGAGFAPTPRRRIPSDRSGTGTCATADSVSSIAWRLAAARLAGAEVLLDGRRLGAAPRRRTGTRPVVLRSGVSRSLPRVSNPVGVGPP